MQLTRHPLRERSLPVGSLLPTVFHLVPACVCACVCPTCLYQGCHPLLAACRHLARKGTRTRIGLKTGGKEKERFTFTPILQGNGEWGKMKAIATFHGAMPKSGIPSRNGACPPATLRACPSGQPAPPAPLPPCPSLPLPAPLPPCPSGHPATLPPCHLPLWPLPPLPLCPSATLPPPLTSHRHRGKRAPGLEDAWLRTRYSHQPPHTPSPSHTRACT